VLNNAVIGVYCYNYAIIIYKSVVFSLVNLVVNMALPAFAGLLLSAVLRPRAAAPLAARGVVVSSVRRMNEVNPRRARLVVLGWVTDFGRVYNLGM